MKKNLSIAIAVVLLLFVSGTAFAGGRKETKFGVGFQGTFPAWGISGMYDVKDNVSVQGILGVFGDLNMYGGRGIYRFKKERWWNAYGYGMIGAWSYTGLEIGWTLREITETAVGFGVGGGIEWDWRVLDPSLPPLFWNLELGLASVRFERVYYDFATIVIGCGVHYRF